MPRLLAKKKRRMRRIAAGVRLQDVGWGPVYEESLQRVRIAVVDAVTVDHPDPDICFFCLSTDSSTNYWASVLTQIIPEEEQAHEPLAFLSGSFRVA